MAPGSQGPGLHATSPEKSLRRSHAGEVTQEVKSLPSSGRVTRASHDATPDGGPRMKVLGINALFHDPAAALVVDGVTLAAAEEERFSRRKHGHRPVPFAAWELPELAARWCLEHAGLDISDVDAVTYSYDPDLAPPAGELQLHDPWDHLRQTYARQAPGFLAAALPGLDPAAVRFVPPHVAHAASAALAAYPHTVSDVLVLDGRGECASHLAATADHGRMTVHAAQGLP